MRTPRLPVVDWTDAPADLNGLVRFAERRNAVSVGMVWTELGALLLVATRCWYCWCWQSEVNGSSKSVLRLAVTLPRHVTWVGMVGSATSSYAGLKVAILTANLYLFPCSKLTLKQMLPYRATHTLLLDSLRCLQTNSNVRVLFIMMYDYHLAWNCMHFLYCLVKTKFMQSLRGQSYK